MKKIIKFGEDIEGFNIAVLNEREIRAAAGILFLIMYVSVLVAALKGDFFMLKYSITFFLADIAIRVFVNPKLSPSLIIGRIIVRNQTPEYVGAQQKKFAWIIGVILAGITFIHLVLLNARSPITGIICLICLTFLFFETAFGICLGCRFYSMMYKEKAQCCPGESCGVKLKHDVLKTSLVQIIFVFGFLGFMLLTIYLFHDDFSKKPYELFGKEIKIPYSNGK